MNLEQQIIIRFPDREHTEPRDIHARLSAHFGDAAHSLKSVQRWCQYIRQGRELLDDEPRSGRPPIDFLDSNSVIPRETRADIACFLLNPETPNFFGLERGRL
jgi:hypothetical protein